MISVSKRFLFVHIPRTGGNSIQSLLRNYSEDEIVIARERQDGIERFGIRSSHPNLRKHSTLAEYRAALGEERFGTLYKFASVRNPWDRMISYYFGTGPETPSWNRDAFEKLVRETAPVPDYLRLEKEADPFVNVNRILRFELGRRVSRALRRSQNPGTILAQI